MVPNPIAFGIHKVAVTIETKMTKRPQPKLTSLTAIILACLAFVGGAVPALAQNQARERKVVFLAGPKEHGAPGRHEYERDLRELAWSLEHSNNLKPIKTVVLVGKAPRDLTLLQDADEIVIDGSGDWLKTETGILFPQFADTNGLTYDPENHSLRC